MARHCVQAAPQCGKDGAGSRLQARYGISRTQLVSSHRTGDGHQIPTGSLRVQSLAGVAAGAGAAGWACSVSVFPSGRVTETKRPPGSPFLSGLPTTFTLSPALTLVAFQPARTRKVGDVISKLQTSAPPLLLGTSTSSQA